MEIKQAFGQRIKQIRAEKKISQEELAWKAGIDTKYLSDVELGKRNVSFLIMDFIVTALGITHSEFWSSELFKQK